MRHIGHSYPIHDAPSKAAGTACYAADMELPRMLHMALLFSPIAHGKVVHLDCSKALALEGVVEILHCFNAEHNTYNRYQTQLGQPLVQNERVFNEHVRFVGDRVAGVIATTVDIARRAVELIEVQYEQYPHALTIQESLTGIINHVHEQGAVYPALPFEAGTKNTDTDLINVQSTSKLGRINHICMEPHACVAHYDPHCKSLTVYSPSQAVFGIRTLLAQMFDMDFASIRVVKTTMGGSFGGKQEWILEPATALASRAVGRPVKLVYTREQCIISTICRSPVEAAMHIDYTPDGRMVNIFCDVSLDAGAYVGNSVNYTNTLGTKFTKIYQCEHIHYVGKAVITNTSVSGAFRGWTSPEATVIIEHNLDLAAKRLGMDRVDIRLKNTHTAYNTDIKGISVGNIQAKESLLRGKELFHWHTRQQEVTAFNAQNTRYKRGIGVALGGHVSGFYPAKTDFGRVDITLTESGSVRCNITLHDHGCGTVTAFSMIVAEAMGLELTDVYMGEGDTNVTPFDIGCFSSRTIYVLGKAAYEAAMGLRQRMKEHFSTLTKVPVEDVDMQGKVIFATSQPETRFTFTQLVEQCQQVLKCNPFYSYEHIPQTNDLVAAAHFAYVEVDTYTCFTKVLDYVAVHDVGQAINREMCVAQVQGAVTMAMGAVLYEHVGINGQGVPKGSLKDYHVVNAFEAPKVRVELIEAGETQGPYNAKSIGEAAIVPAASAFLSAINDALDTDLGAIPLIPDTLAQHLISLGRA